MTDTPHGPYPYAGIPWFSTPFGRDGIITALELLWAAPDVARGVLTFLAETQATARRRCQGRAARQDPARDARRRDGGARRDSVRPLLRIGGRHAALRHAGRTRTSSAPADLAFIERSGRTSWRRSTGWTATATSTATASSSTRGAARPGSIQQGWKDSWDSVFHADGSLAAAPIALCEIQGYAYAAWSGAARLAAARGDMTQAERWRAARGRAAGRLRAGVLVRRPRHLRAGARRATSSRAGSARRTRATACSPASPGPSARAGSPTR